MEPNDWDDVMTAYTAAIDQMVAVSRAGMRAVAEYHAACLGEGVPPSVADVLALRFAARMLVLPAEQDGAWGGAS